MRDVGSLETYLNDILSSSSRGMSEHALLKRLREQGCSPFAGADLGDTLTLFQLHFLLFHALYRLRERLWSEGRGHLDISPLNIALHPYRSGVSGLTEADPLRGYYLDLGNLQLGRQDVEALLDSFWRRLRTADSRQGALAVLGLTDPVDYEMIRKRYRSLAMAHHPDRGGDTVVLQEINQAMDVLEREYRR